MMRRMREMPLWSLRFSYLFVSDSASFLPPFQAVEACCVVCEHLSVYPLCGQFVCRQFVHEVGHAMCALGIKSDAKMCFSDDVRFDVAAHACVCVCFPP